MKALKTNIIYENPLPQLNSRQSAFSSVCELGDGKIVASFAIGEAFESVDSKTYIATSTDGGESFSAPRLMLDFESDVPVTSYCKIISDKDGTLYAIGYAFYRPDPTLPLGNPVTGGLLDDFIFYSVSHDGGESWEKPTKIDSPWGPHTEVSAPLLRLADGSLITPITGFPDWEGKPHGDTCGRALISRDGGKTWSADAVCMRFEGRNVTCYEQRMCQLDSGAIICIGWNEDLDSGARLENHYTFSLDGGKTFSAPKSTGVMGQASFVLSLGGEKLLAIHSLRRDTERPGIYGYIVDFSDREWKIESEALLWEPSMPITKDTKMAEIFSFLKFGQPSAILLKDGDVLMTHWFAEAGQYKTCTTRIKL